MLVDLDHALGEPRMPEKKRRPEGLRLMFDGAFAKTKREGYLRPASQLSTLSRPGPQINNARKPPSMDKFL